MTQKNILAVKFKEYSDTFDVQLFNIWDKKPDCKIGHFGYNFYFRTPKGMKGEQYKNIKTLWRAIKRVAKRHGLTAESLGVQKRYRYRVILT